MNKREIRSIITKKRGTQENEMEACALNKRATISIIMKRKGGHKRMIWRRVS